MDNAQLVKTHSDLPSTLEELSRFILFNREKLVVVRAEIRAIERLNLAQEVKAQKQEEAIMIAAAILDAEVKMGALLKQLPKITGRRPKRGLQKTYYFVKTKNQAIEELGLSKKQAYMFEVLSENEELVEQLKEESIAKHQPPSRTKIIAQIKQQKTEGTPKQQDHPKKKADDEATHHMRLCAETYKKVDMILLQIDKLELNDEFLQLWGENYKRPRILQYDQERLDQSLSKMSILNNFIKGLEL